MATLNDNSYIGGIPFFLNAVLSTPAGALPKGPLWVVAIELDNNILTTIKSVRSYEPSMPVNSWDIDAAVNTITSHRYQKEKGCVLAQTVTVPGEALITNVDGLQYNGYIRSRVGAGRQDFDFLRIGFLNTNVNFVDNVIRPWVVMTGHLGLIARPDVAGEKYRTVINVYKLGVYSQDVPPFVLQQYTFWGCCPVGITSEDLSYNAESTATIKSADFIYQWYTTNSQKNRFATGSVPDLRGAIQLDPNQPPNTVARAVDPNAPVEVRRPLGVNEPGPFGN